MAHVAQMLTQETIYKSSSVFCFKPILLSAHKLTLLIYRDNRTLEHTQTQAGLSSELLQTLSKQGKHALPLLP